MSYRWVGFFLAFLLLLGCSDNSGVLGPDAAAPSIMFDKPSPLPLAPKQAVVINVTSSVRPVTLSLAGDYLDAFLETEALQDGKNALLIRPGDTEALEASIHRLIEDNDLRRRLIKDGRVLAQEHRWDRCVEKINTILEEVTFKND